jgi:hypothetical protein
MNSSPSSQPEKIKILVCTSNMGNKQPTIDSLKAWIPKDGSIKDVLENPRYPLVRTSTPIHILKSADASLLTQSDSNTNRNNMASLANVSSHGSSSDDENPIPDKRDHPSDEFSAQVQEKEKEESNLKFDIDSASDDDNSIPDKRDHPSDEYSAQVEEKEKEESNLKFDIVVIGFQEATFEPEDEEGEERISFRGGLINSLKAASDLTTAKNHLEKARKQLERKASIDPQNRSSVASLADPSKPSMEVSLDPGAHTNMLSSDASEASENRKSSMSEAKLIGMKHADDTHVLHDLLQDQLPSYTQAVSYQSGQMRLMMFYNGDAITLDVISVKAQNTGRAGLANKGGIVAEVNINGGTRIAFFTAHLEAHEGASKYATRCSTVGDIFRGTTSDVTKCLCDPSLASHFMFAMGDLNFRTKLPDHEAGSPEHVTAVHELAEKKDWATINEHDELAAALRRRDCFVGFSTPLCWFPPTFKVHRQGGYVYNDQRSPSYTDRILYKGSHRLGGKIKVLTYEPIDNFTSSDHKPIRGAFEVELNPKLKWRPTLVQG